MLIADGGGGYGGTDWMSKDVRFMWSTVADQNTDPHFDVVGGWRRTAELILAHMTQVQVYRDNLASVWPPTKSPAAAAYLNRLDMLINDLKATHDAASANYTAFSTVALTLSMARNKLKPILEQYQANEQLNLDWQAKQDELEAKKPAFAPVFKLPPVAAGQQEALNNQARAVMYDLSSTLLSGQAALKKPEPYKPNETAFYGDPDHSNSGSGDGFVPPPVIPAPGASSSGGAGGTVTPVSNVTLHPAPPANAIPSGPGSVVGGPSSGPVLGGIGPAPVLTPPAPGLTPIGGPTPGPTPPGLIPGVIGPGGGGGLGPAGAVLPSGGKLPPSGLTRPGGIGGGAGRMAMPSGGVIGASPGSGTIGQMPPGGMGNRSGGATARPNPVGGVIGQQGGTPGGRPSATGGRGGSAPTTPFGNQAGQRRNRRDESTENEHWDPDNPWATDEGVDPVVLPPQASTPIDPGPAIGYSR